MALKCVAVDDEPLALRVIDQYVSRIPALELVETFEDSIAASEYLRSSHCDILFVDINMPDITDIDLVRSLDKKPVVIFTTAYRNFAFEGYELDALDYLLKPIQFERFSKAVRKAIDHLDSNKPPKEEADDSLYINSEYRLVKIPLKDIDFIESLEDYIRIHLQGEKPVMTLMTMKKVLEKLPEDRFRRIHRSYIIPVNKIQAIANRRVKLLSGRELPISDTYSSFINDLKKS